MPQGWSATALCVFGVVANVERIDLAGTGKTVHLNAVEFVGASDHRLADVPILRLRTLVGLLGRDDRGMCASEKRRRGAILIVAVID